MGTPLSLAALSSTLSIGSPVFKHLNADPLNGLSGYQCPWNLSFKAFSSSSPKMFTRRLGNLLYRYEMTKLRATCTSICILKVCFSKASGKRRCERLVGVEVGEPRRGEEREREGSVSPGCLGCDPVLYS